MYLQLFQFLKVVKCCSVNLSHKSFYRQASSTIYAVSSGQGKCGVTVIRISGSESSSVMTKVAGLNKLPEPRKSLLRRLKHPQNNEILDQGLVLWFPGPHSFTGEDSCELQVHGGTAVVSAVLGALASIPGLRPALPGEFTKRAFYSNKLDLTAVEGLADLIHAETEMQRKQALLQMGGALAQRYSQWSDLLKRSIAHVEAYIDFSEDQNIEDDILETTNQQLRLLQQDIQSHLQDGRRGERMRDGVKTVIAGAPNVGKSSLLNVLCKRPAAIVNSQPGTTRDIISSTLDIAGFPVVLNDTAGLRRHTSDLIEKEGIIRTHQSLSNADLILLVIDSTHYQTWLETAALSEHTFREFFEAYTKELNLEETVLTCKNIEKILDSKSKITDIGGFCLVVFNKIDLIEDKTAVNNVCSEFPDCVVSVSCKNSEHLEILLEKLQVFLEKLCGNPTRESLCLTQARHRYHVTACVAALDRYITMCGSEREIDVAAEQLRQALRALGHITGHVSTDQILDVIFRDFCIGK